MVDYKFLFLTKESFKFIKDYENYMISDEGRVFSIKSHKFLKPCINSMGYYHITLSKNGIAKRFKVHKLVINAFLKNPDNKKSVDHINNNKIDNRLINLRWCSQSENIQNANLSKRNTTGVKGISYNKKNNKYHVLIMINKKHKHIGYFKTLEEATIARKQVANEIFKEFTNACEKC
jgi:hypothetical protein